MTRSEAAVAATQRDISKRWSMVILALLILLYWLLARQLERIDLTAWDWWQARAAAFPLLQAVTPLITFVAEIFSLRVLRHLFPVVVGAWLARSLVISMVQLLYDLPGRNDAKQFFSRLQSRQSHEPPIRLERRTFAEARLRTPLLRIGGPGQIWVDKGDVAVTELNGRFHRILPTGKHHLVRFEQVRAILDLRPQDRQASGISLVTRDGIGLKCDVGVTFRILPGDEPPTKSRPFPFDREAVRHAAYTETVMIDGAVSAWDSVALTVTIGKLNAAVSEYRLDELIHPENPRANPHTALVEEVERQARATAVHSGIHIMHVRLGRFEAPEPVTNQRISYWQAHWQKEQRINEADGMAVALTETEKARAEAESEMLQAIVESIERVENESQFTRAQEIIALRLVEVLEKLAQSTEDFSPLPAELIPQIRAINQQLLLGTEPPTPIDPGEDPLTESGKD